MALIDFIFREVDLWFVPRQKNIENISTFPKITVL